MTSPLLAVITQLWERRFPNDEAAFASTEFKRLCDVAAEVHCRPDSPFELEDKNDLAMHVTDMRNAMRNIGAPWNADIPLPPAAAAQTIDKAFAAPSCLLTHLIPLDLADELPSVRFGPWRIQSFDSTELGNLVGLARLNRFGHTRVVDVKRLSSFRWAVLEESIPVHSENRWRHLFRGWDDIGKVRHVRRQFEPAIERGLFVLSLYPWEDLTEADYVTWQPFQFPWKNRVRLGMLHKWSSFPTRTCFLGNPVRSVQRARLGSSRSFPVTCASKGIACISCRGYAGASTDLAQKGT